MNAVTVIALSFFILLSTEIVFCSSRIRIENNGYNDILVALPSTAATRDRSRIIGSLKNLLQRASLSLETATKGRAQIHSATLLIPRNWGISDDWKNVDENSTSFEDAPAALNHEAADIIVTDSGKNEHPYTLHHQGCGHQALRIYLQSHFLLSGRMPEKSMEFVRLWSEFRYGVFPEGGFADDEKYPDTYQVPGESANRTTGCKDEDSITPDRCAGNECGTESIISSLMDQHLPHTVTRFCEGEMNIGPKHNPDAPSKHNLMCREEGTWFTVLRSPDFANGKNAAPKYLADKEVIFRFVRENHAAQVVVAIETSTKMSAESRYLISKNAFSQFVFASLPDDSRLTLFTFGGLDGANLITCYHHLQNEQARMRYLESQPLPETLPEEDEACVDCLLDHIFEVLEGDNSTTVSQTIIIVTTKSLINSTRYRELQQKLVQSESRLYVLLFADDYNENRTQNASLFDLCSETGGRLVSVPKGGLSDLYRGFADAIRVPNADVLITQKYLSEDDDRELVLDFNVDPSAFESIKVFLSGPFFNNVPLEYEETSLSAPSGTMTPQKQEIIPAWVFHVSSPQTGNYTLSTRRKERATSPVLVSVTGQPIPRQYTITAKVWVEVLYSTPISPPPVQIFAEVKKGIYPIKDAEVVASVFHPDGKVSEFMLLDDGRGDTDISSGDGVYGRYFTNYTTAGFYNVYVKVSGGVNETAVVLKGPADYCCGSTFSWSLQDFIGPFMREAGPATFEVTSARQSDQYPPARITDLRFYNIYDDIYVLQWSTVGDDYDQNYESGSEPVAYEVKVFPDKYLIRNRFNGSGLELYSKRIETEDWLEYGTNLFYALRLPRTDEGGHHYFAVRGVDSSGNTGEPSNILHVWVEPKTVKDIDCTDEDQPTAQRLNSASILLPFISLLFWVLILHNI